MNAQEIIELYEQIATLTRQMLEAAQHDDWDRLVVLETQTAQRIQHLRTHLPATGLTEPLREKKVTLIQRILADDRAIRHLTEPWMTRLTVLINSTGTERKLSHAYNALPSS